MNERINELEKQAWDYVDATWDWTNPDNPSKATLFKKKFAELIICASAQFLVDKFDFCGNEILAAEELAKNFGVEWTFRIDE